MTHRVLPILLSRGPENPDREQRELPRSYLPRQSLFTLSLLEWVRRGVELNGVLPPNIVLAPNVTLPALQPVAPIPAGVSKARQLVGHLHLLSNPAPPSDQSLRCRGLAAAAAVFSR